MCLLFLLSYGIFGFQTNWFFIYIFFSYPPPPWFSCWTNSSVFLSFLHFCLFYVYVLFGMLRLSLDYGCPCGEIYWNQIEFSEWKIEKWLKWCQFSQMYFEILSWTDWDFYIWRLKRRFIYCCFETRQQINWFFKLYTALATIMDTPLPLEEGTKGIWIPQKNHRELF